MGATRKLALVVVVGLIAISTAITVYTANEPNRRASEEEVQQGVSIERAASLYITYCLQCHGPAGLGTMELDADGNPMGRTGAPLNQSLMTQEQLEGRFAIFQSDDPVEQGIAEDWIRFKILYGAPDAGQLSRNYSDVPAMPAFRHDLNVEEINNLVWMIMHGNWNHVYNASVHYTGQSVCEATPEAERTGACEGDAEDAVAYPTVPPDPEAEAQDVDAAGPEDPADDETGTGDVPGTDDADNGDSDGENGDADNGEATNGAEHQVTATDNAFDADTMTVRPGDTITLVNDGFAQHDFVVDELGMDTGLLNNSETNSITVPEDAEPGDYEFYCSVVGHREAGMVGTLTVEAP